MTAVSERAVGQDIVRADAPPKVDGSAAYTSDIRLPGVLYARVLRSPLPHARIRSIDTSKARSLPGVHAVLSSADNLDVTWYQNSTLFPETVRLVGDEVAAVAAESEAIANDALALISVEYESLSFELDLERAQANGSAEVTERAKDDANDEPKVIQRGDIDAGIGGAAHSVEQTYTTPIAVHNSLEPHGSVAAWDAGDLTLWDSTQGVFAVRKSVAEALGLHLNQVRVIKQFMGGGFGAKQIPWKNAAIAALLAKQAGRPVQLMLDRPAENLAVGHRNATRQQVRLGADADGSLVAIDATIDQDIGAYKPGGEASDTSGPYHVFYGSPNAQTTQRAVRTNRGPAIAFRAPGFAEAAFALESAMDELAHRVGMDPLEFRLRNLAEEDGSRGLPFSTPGALKAALLTASERFGWDGFESRRSGRFRRGRGVAVQVWGGSGWPPAKAQVKWSPDGTASVITGSQDIGTGTRTALAQVAGDALGIPPERVRVLLGDTSMAPYAPTSAGSATLASAGPAVLAACRDAAEQLLRHAAEMWQIERAAVALDATSQVVRARDGRQKSIQEVLEDVGPGEILGLGERGPNATDVSVKSFGAQMIEVEVDTLLGSVRVVRVVTAQDCGLVVNPKLFRSQVIGGVTQGLGFALFEQQIADCRLGVPLNANLEEYLVPTIADIPAIDVIQLGEPDYKANTLGAKGIGEPPIIGTAAAVANAVFDATGLRFRDLPLTRKRVLDAIRAEGLR